VLDVRWRTFALCAAAPPDLPWPHMPRLDPLSRMIIAIGALVLAVTLVPFAATSEPPPAERVSAAGDHAEPLPAEEGADPVPSGVGGRTADDPGAAPGDDALADVPAAPLVDPDRTSIAWSSGGLRAGVAQRIEALPQVEEMTLVRAGMLELVRSRDADGALVDERSGGWVLPLDAIAVNTDTYPGFYEGAEALAELGEGEAILSETSARLRGLGPGASLRMADGELLVVADVLPDGLVGGAEVVVDVATGRTVGVDRDRFVLVRHTGSTPELHGAIIPAIADLDDRPLRVLPTEGERVLRHGLGVLTQAEVKDAFGEFAYRDPSPSREVVQEQAWRDEHLVTERVPILGQIRCHRKLVPLVREILTELEEDGLGHLVDPKGYAGCHHPRLTNRQDAVSRHSWGIGIDLNFPDNLVGTPGSMDPRLIERFAERGFTWGGTWLLTDPTHFELVVDPDA
jgi:hypothetical protein